MSESEDDLELMAAAECSMAAEVMNAEVYITYLTITFIGCADVANLKNCIVLKHFFIYKLYDVRQVLLQFESCSLEEVANLINDIMRQFANTRVLKTRRQVYKLIEGCIVEDVLHSESCCVLL